MGVFDLVCARSDLLLEGWNADPPRELDAVGEMHEWVQAGVVMMRTRMAELRQAQQQGQFAAQADRVHGGPGGPARDGDDEPEARATEICG